MAVDSSFELVELKVVDVKEVAEVFKGGWDYRAILRRRQKANIINHGGAYKGRESVAMAAEDICKGAHK